MNTLIIYDNNGTIFFQASGNIQTPVGLQHMIVNVPTNQMIQRIDTSTEVHTPVFVEIPRPQIEVEVETLKADNEAIKADNEMLKMMVADLGLMVGGGL